ncbi:hypothetical protein L227DRAFT_578222 [Lentinus tigrinus ALCF2SS1-6]|uniref:Uncharacterized protein n=1 Tax=Lentinus tigrinus ALCF2SS1-6 TaxID=1328759 RepID=A0A5C2S0S8_9APHY|nr:hypothetical protein L227DRAFT_578222 [Lentinus tigrinus ALCF2SS1-6]
MDPQPHIEFMNNSATGVRPLALSVSVSVFVAFIVQYEGSKPAGCGAKLRLAC